MTVTVRPTRKEEVALLPPIEQSAGDAFRSIPDLAWIADDEVMPVASHLRFIATKGSWVAVDDTGLPCGFLCAERCSDALHIWELAVRHDAQGRGIGRALIDSAIARAKAQRLACVTLTTFRDVVFNETFYQRCGFSTLTASQLDERLRGILRQETENGLPPEKRCAMRLQLNISYSGLAQ